MTKPEWQKAAEAADVSAAPPEAAPKAAQKAAPEAATKKVRGKPFVKGKSGNPAGLKPGTRHRKTLMLEHMSDDDRAAIVSKIIRQAKRGDRPSQKMIVDRIEPPRKGRAAPFSLPPIKTAADVVGALATVTAAMAAGKISPAEAVEIAAVIETARRAIEPGCTRWRRAQMTNNELQRRLEALEKKMNSSEHRGESSQPLKVVAVFGCLPPGIPLWGTAGRHERFPDPGEELEAFAERAAAAARALKEPLLVLGGLPKTQAQNDVALPAYDAWLLTDDGVPPVEPGRGIRA